MEGFRVVCDVHVRFADTDALGHVNNAVYLNYIEVARVRYLQEVLGRREVKDFGVILARAEVDYKSPAFHHETLRVGCRVESLGGSSMNMSYRVEEKETGRLVALAKTVLVAYDYALARPVRIPQDARERMEAFDGIA
ncbi:MAG: thioesterase family protein [Elusimicrobiota bacterium]|nr:thioesterase family protein [Elusimicrobiota bacterium]